MRHTFALSAFAAGAAVLAPGAVSAQDTRTEALGAMNMLTSGSGVFTFSSARRDGAADVFTDVGLILEPDVTIETLRIEGARMEGGRPVFDALVFQGLSGPVDGQGAAAAPVDGKGPGAGAPADGLPGVLSINEVRLVGPNQETAAAIAQALFQPGQAENLSYQGVNSYGFAQIALEGLSVTTSASNGESGTVTLGSITFDDLSQGAAGAVVLSNLALAGTFDMDGDLTPLTLNLANFSLRDVNFGALEAAAGEFNPSGLNSVAMGEFLLEGLAGSATSPEGMPVTFNVGEIRLNDWSPTGAELIRFRDISLDGTFDMDGQMSPISFGLQNYELNGLDLSNLAGVYDALGAGGQVQNAIAQAMVMNPFEPPLDNYTLTGFEADIAGVQVSLAEANGRVDPNRAGFDYTDIAGPLRVTFDPASQVGAQAMMGLGMLGISQLEFNFVSRWTANQVEDRIRSQEYTVSMTDGFDLSMDYDVANVSAYINAMRQAYSRDGFDAAFEDDPQEVFAMLGDLTFNGAGVTYEDRGIAPRIITMAAPFLMVPPSGAGVEDDKGPGETDDAPSSGSGLGGQVAALIRMQAQNELPGATQDLAFAFADAVEVFLNDPQSFAIRVAPSSPVSIAELNRLGENDPNAAVTRLNITFEANGGGR